MNIPFSIFDSMHNEIKNDLIEAFNEVLDANWFIKGKQLMKFEADFAEYCNTKFCVGCGNGLDALVLLLKAFEIGIGDEVIVPANTFIATALAVSYVGAKPILVDCDEFYNIDVNLIETAITAKTKAIIPVHLYGLPADMDKINDLAKKYNLVVIEDAAQAHGAVYKGRVVGSLGNGAGFSFYPGKNLGALGDGGAIVTNSEDIAMKVQKIGNYGSDKRYFHELKGVNSRLDEVQAAFLNIKLDNLTRWTLERKEIAQQYLDKINNEHIILPKILKDVEHVWHLFVIRTKYRDELKEYLEEKGIQTLVHYPIPLHLQEAYQDLGLKEGMYPKTEKYAQQILSLPLWYGMNQEEIDYVCSTINEFKVQK